MSEYSQSARDSKDANVQMENVDIDDKKAGMEQLKELYAPIQSELSSVRDELVAILTDEKDELAELCEYVVGYKGKMLRPALLLLCGKICGNIGELHKDFAVILELIHLTTLIHDDVIDEADIRRNKRVLNHLWGNQASVLFGDYLLSKAFDLCNKTGDIRSAKKISETTQIICRGEIMQTLRKSNWRVDEEEYMRIIGFKTASLYELCCSLGASLSKANEKVICSLERYGNFMGLAFQISDDLLDIIGDGRKIGKDIGRDLSQGKATLPIIHFMRTASGAAIDEFLMLVENVDDNIIKIRSLLESSGSILYTRNKIAELISLANGQLDEFPASESKESLMRISYFIARRL